MDEQSTAHQPPADEDSKLSSLYQHTGMTEEEFRAAEAFLSELGSTILARHKAITEGDAISDDSKDGIDIEKYVSASVVHAFSLMAADGVFSEEINQKFKDDPAAATKQLCEELLLFKNVNNDDLDQISLFPEEEINLIPKLISIIPETYLVPNNKLANTMTKGIVGKKDARVKVSPKTAKTPIYTICNLIYRGDNVKLTGRQTFTEYDRNVYNAVTTLFVYGDQRHIVTPAMVFRAMNGMSNTQDPSPQQIGAVTKSLDKMRFIEAAIDCTQEFEQRRIPFNGKKITLKDYLLNASAVEADTGSQIVKAYLINRPPILYVYSNKVNQVLSVPSSLLDIKKIDQGTGQITKRSVSTNPSRIVIRGYLLNRIEGMKGKNALKQHTISLFSYKKDGDDHRGIYEIAGYPEPSKTEAKRIREYVDQVLMYWTAEKYISGYKWNTRDKKIVGVEIDP